MATILPVIELEAQNNTIAPDTPVYIDNDGIIRWSDSGEEIALFGVNYSIPFAHGYRAIDYVGGDHEKAIDQDVYHFARMGLTAYRIHVWDIEISNQDGDLVENDHLRLLDYLIMRLKERGIKIILSQMRNSDNAYPEYNDVLGYGFSRIYPKNGGLAHHTPEGVQAQERYVHGFVNHANPYTGLSYKDDPDILAFEVNNEPHHNGSVVDTRNYINRMVASMRQTGMQKPIFYNMSHNFDITEAFLTADIQGGTFQWYPTGLNAGFTQKGNFLPNVDNYSIPFSEEPRFLEMAKMVYEFDAADVTDAYLYPAMARSFRQAGFQFMTQFAYDSMTLGHINSEYKTHHLNLAYTPSKAISFKIAAEVSRRVPREADYGTYPENMRFDAFRLDYTENLSEMVTDEAFYYSNDTDSTPENPGELQHVAGVGSSPLVRYEGTGAYFLDQLDEGVWRLEVMPDAVMTHDPYDDPNIDKSVVRILWNEWPMTLVLPDLGTSFSYRGIDLNNRTAGAAAGGTFSVHPGVYILTREGVSSNQWTGDEMFNNIRINEYAAPGPSDQGETVYDVVQTPANTASADEPLRISAVIAGPNPPDEVELLFSVNEIGEPRPAETMRGYDPETVPMRRIHEYTYESVIPESLLTSGGGIMYYIVLPEKDQDITFPGKFTGRPGDWDFYSRDFWGTRLVDPDSPLQLLNVETDYNKVLPLRTSYGSAGQTRLVAGSGINNHALRVDANLSNNRLLFLRQFIGDRIDGRRPDLENFSHVVIRARALNGNTGTLQFGFITTDAYTYAAPFELTTSYRDIRIPLNDFSQARTALRLTYPRMMEEYFSPVLTIPFDIKKIENWEISTSDLFQQDQLSYELENIWLE